ncbi:hypothetical protein ACE3MQ_20000 [Paenibacillus lentus]|uniref:hypothetical protein n=1 Tax=Paenibacillus lentus TaxID=1338368 RepID=UPI00365FADFA
MAELSLMFGAVAVVGAFFTGGVSLYLYAALNGAWGLAQIGVSIVKLRDLNDGIISDSSFFGINQEMVYVAGAVLTIVDITMLGKAAMKGANTAANIKYMKGIDQIFTPKVRLDRVVKVSKEMELENLAKKSSSLKETPNLKNEKELLDAIEKMNTSPHESLGVMGKTEPKPAPKPEPKPKPEPEIEGTGKGPNKYLEKPADENGTLNIGARGKPIEGAYNIDIDPKSPDVYYGDATQLTNIKTGSQSRIIIENPFGYDPLNPEILRVLSRDGEIIITGSRSNMKKLLRQLEDKGLKIKGERRDVPNDGSYLTTDGEKIMSPMLDQYTFIRK